MLDTVVYVGAILGLLGAVWLAPPLVHRAVQTFMCRNTAKRLRRIALTYDDGPGSGLTPPLLDLLALHRAPSTFFLLGCRTEISPDLARGLVKAGHEVGLHSFDHLNAWTSPPWRAVQDLHRDAWACGILGDAPRLIRPPFGKMTLATWLWTLLRGWRVAWWTFDSGDTWPDTPDPDLTARRLIQAGGGVVLLHDFDREGHPDREARCAYVLAVTRAILEQGREAGFAFCRYSDFGCKDRETNGS